MIDPHNIPPMPPEIEAAYERRLMVLDDKIRYYRMALSSDPDIIAATDELRATLDTISDARLIELTTLIRERMQAIRDFHFPKELRR